jgi:hypothetical protein
VPGIQSQSQPGSEQDPYSNSSDIMRMKSVHLDRKLSAKARIAIRSTIVESPTGKTVQPTDMGIASERSREFMPTVANRPPGQGQLPPQSAAVQSVPMRPPRPQQSQSPQFSQTPSRSINGPQVVDDGQQGQVLRPPFARNNTEVMIVDHSAPTSPAMGSDEQPPLLPVPDEGITLADLPQLMEAAQAREQHRSLPRQSQVPFIAELSALELAIVKHCAVLVLHGSPLRNEFDLDEMLELIEVKKSGFFAKFFKGGNDKKIKKKGN